MTQGLARGYGVEAARLQPQDTVCATLDWPLPPGDGEDAILPDVVTALSLALAACGRVAFRYDEPLKGADAFDPAPGRSILHRLLSFFNLGEYLFGIAVVSNADQVKALFECGWTFAVQSALVFDPAADPAPIIAALRGGLDWRGRTLPEGARLLFGPGHDGDFAVVAAANTLWLQRFNDALK